MTVAHSGQVNTHDQEEVAEDAWQRFAAVEVVHLLGVHQIPPQQSQVK